MRTYLLFFLVCFLGCKSVSVSSFNAENQLDYCVEEISETLKYLDVDNGFPRTVKEGDSLWTCTGYSAWTSGFFPGLLWYLYEHSGDKQLCEAATRFSDALEPVKSLSWNTHDVGFMMYNGVGHAARITGDKKYKKWMLQTADSLASLYNPDVGTILSWPWMKEKRGWPHNTIIDNMLNLELLFWASENGGDRRFYDIAVDHARTTMKNHFREDYSTYHVVVYNDHSSEVLKRITDQGYSDESVWARGQAWAIYGYAMCFRETGIPEFKTVAMNAADYFISHLPDDHVPYWDFEVPGKETEEKDASAAAIAASAFLELASLIEEPSEKNRYKEAALNILTTLSSEKYRSHDTSAILDHSVGSKPHESEIDLPIIYADYYYVEALVRLKKWF